MIIESFEQQAINAIRDAGIIPPEEIAFDGLIHRFNAGKNGGDKPGWYVFYQYPIPAGAFGDWRETHESTHIWCAKSDKEYTAVELTEFREKQKLAIALREKESLDKHEDAAKTAKEIWDSAAIIPDYFYHPYLKNKDVGAHDIRLIGGRLVIPVFTPELAIKSLQYINDDGSKRFLSGGEFKGGFFIIDGEGKDAFICEGYATGASIFEATGKPVFVAFSASNLDAVIANVKKLTTSIIIVADNDQNQTGQKAANAAGEKHKCKVIVIPELGDANDYKKNYGKTALRDLLIKKIYDWILPLDLFLQNQKAIPWLIEGVIPQQGLVMLHGPSGSGKTFAVVDWALTIAMGCDFWHDKRLTNGKVAYLAGEGHTGLRMRFAAWCQFHNKQPKNLWVSSSGCDLDTPEGLKKVIDTFSNLDIKPALIVIDTLHRFMTRDENSAKDSKLLIDACGKLIDQYSCSVLLVHHTGHNQLSQERGRGSSAWRAALDVEFSIQPESEGAPLQIIQRKNKDADLCESIEVKLEVITLEGFKNIYGEITTSAVLVPIGPVKLPAPAPKNNHKIEKAYTSWANSWRYSGRVWRDGKPYLSRMEFKKYLTEHLGMAERTADNHLRPTREDGYICLLIPYLSMQGNEGWYLDDQVRASALKLEE